MEVLVLVLAAAAVGRGSYRRGWRGRPPRPPHGVELSDRTAAVGFWFSARFALVCSIDGSALCGGRSQRAPLAPLNEALKALLCLSE